MNISDVRGRAVELLWYVLEWNTLVPIIIVWGYEIDTVNWLYLDHGGPPPLLVDEFAKISTYTSF